MLHLLSSLFFIAILLGTGALIVDMIRAELGGAWRPGRAPRPWRIRVRRIAPRAVRVRRAAARAAA